MQRLVDPFRSITSHYAHITSVGRNPCHACHPSSQRLH
jgi:hypothetical protein